MDPPPGDLTDASPEQPWGAADIRQSHTDFTKARTHLDSAGPLARGVHRGAALGPSAGLH